MLVVSQYHIFESYKTNIYRVGAGKNQRLMDRAVIQSTLVLKIPCLVYTVNVDFIRFKYVVLAKYLHMSIFEFYLLIKQHSLILCKNLLWLLFW